MSNLPPGVTDRMIDYAYGDPAEGDAIAELLDEQSPEVLALATAMRGRLDKFGYVALSVILGEAQDLYDELGKLGMTLTRGQDGGPDA